MFYRRMAKLVSAGLLGEEGSRCRREGFGVHDDTTIGYLSVRKEGESEVTGGVDFDPKCAMPVETKKSKGTSDQKRTLHTHLADRKAGERGRRKEKSPFFGGIMAPRNCRAIQAIRDFVGDIYYKGKKKDCCC